MGEKTIYLDTRCPLDQVGPKHSGTDKAICGSWCQWFDDTITPTNESDQRTACRFIDALERIARIRRHAR